MLPNFLIIGASRSGTTFLKNALQQHPKIFMGGGGAYTGDIHFFNKSHPAQNWQKGLHWYEHFFSGRTTEKAVGEKSALYFDDPEAPQLIKQVLGESVKLIAILRNPIERAYSSYWYQIEDFPRGVKFLEACKMERENRLRPNSFLHRPGFYHDHLTNYLKYFDGEKLLFIILDFLKMDPLYELRRVFRFLEVEEDFIPEKYDKKVNQAIGEGGLTYGLKKSWGYIKQNYPHAYHFIKKLPPSKWLRIWLGKSSDKVAKNMSYPDMSAEEWHYLSELYYKNSKNMGKYLGIDLISLWHQPPDHLRYSEDKS